MNSIAQMLVKAWESLISSLSLQALPGLMLIPLLEIGATPGAFMFPVTLATWVGYLILTLALRCTSVVCCTTFFLDRFKIFWFRSFLL